MADSELDILRRKLEIARLPTNIASAQWGERNGFTLQKMANTLEYWRTRYNWREEEAQINQLPQFKTPIDVDGFGTLDLHFVHSRSSSPNAIPLIFLHGWPGSFVEVSKILPKLNEAGYDVVAPSLPGYGFSSYPDKAGFKLDQHAETFHKLMSLLRYDKYVVQGGDWGSFIARVMAIKYPDKVQAMHINMLFLDKPDFKEEPHYTQFERQLLQRKDWLTTKEFGYCHLQTDKPRTLGFGLHDSPVAMLSWMADKLFGWTDNYHWGTTELITWTLLHYFPGPMTALEIYNENPPEANLKTGTVGSNYVNVPSGVSAFPKELAVVPKSWAETKLKLVFYREHKQGGHFAAWEKPDELVGDMIEFYKSVWKI